jgi:predicted alpha/beta hydrolase family esterase
MNEPQRIIYFVINGIHTNPGKANAWTDEAATWLNLNTPDHVKAEKYEYFTTALTRWWKQGKRARELATKALAYQSQGYQVRMIGHSNGCDLIARVILRRYKSDVSEPAVRVHTAHLIAPAAKDEDFAEIAEDSLARQIHLYGSRNDKALQAATLSQRALGWLGLGFGSLGLRGSDLAQRYPARVQDHSRDHYGHGTWIGGLALPGTLTEILHNDGLKPKP